MVGLLDIAPSMKSVKINGTDVHVYGVSAKGIAHLLARFPQVRAMFDGNKTQADFSPEALMELVPDAIASIIAAGTGYPGDAKAEEVAGMLPAEAQLDLLEAIIELTMPRGAGPFVERLQIVMGNLAADSGKAPRTKSPPPSNP